MQFDLPLEKSNIIKVIGVGGGGSNAVNHMYRQGIIGVDFCVCNTDKQALFSSPVPNKIQLGPDLTHGLGAGSKPVVGKNACEESIEEVKRFLSNNTKMVFITAGMGGGTGTGAAPIIARAAREMNILTVGIVTLPFFFEGSTRVNQGKEGLEELKQSVDSLIVISNDKLREIYGNLGIREAFMQADNILTTAAKGIAEIITVPGYINVDFRDVETVMRNSGVAIMGTAIMGGDRRAKLAVDAALSSPLLEDNDIRGAKHILLNIASGTMEVTMDEIFEITQFIHAEVGQDTNLIWGNCYDETLGDKLGVTIIATGFSHEEPAKVEKKPETIVMDIDGVWQGNKITITDIGEFIDTGQTHAIVLDGPTGPRVLGRNGPSFQEPFLNEGEARKREESRQRLSQEEMDKRIKMRTELAKRVNDPQLMVDLENEPAYVRRGVQLMDSQQSGPSDLSRYSIGEGENPQIRENNSFLYDALD